VNEIKDTGKQKKGFIQFLKFMLVSALAGIIQIVLANILPLVFDRVTTPIPSFLRGIFDPELLFNTDTETGLWQVEKYVVDGAVTWGYVLPFFLSNAIANIYGYFQNKKTTFKSDAPAKNFVIYFAVLTVLILCTTWLQGLIVGLLNSSPSLIIRELSRTIGAAAAGFVQFLVLFPLEKFVLLKEKKTN